MTDEAEARPQANNSAQTPPISSTSSRYYTTSQPSGEESSVLSPSQTPTANSSPRGWPAEATGDRVRHAMSSSRPRSATEHDKRSACIALAGVLEERGDLLKSELMRQDEGALLTIANNSAIRHQTAQQQNDYDPVFLDWVCWLYLPTIELTDRLRDRDAST